MSKKVKFEIGDRVLTIVDNEVCKGSITRLHLDLPRPVAIIALDDESMLKTYVKDIIPEPKEVKEEPEKVQEEPKRESVEKSEITITPKEFMNISNSVIAREVDSIPLGIAMSILMSKIHLALFVDAGNND